MRGKPKLTFPAFYLPGITPAGAGKTVCCRLSAGANQDHPRRCGENLVCAPLPLRSWGSPPQVRGKHPRGGCCFCPSRITPAGAGKTTSDFRNVIIEEDHPRRCGENPYSIDFISTRIGSPPQVRGKLKYDFTQSKTIGITPAGAGKTSG